MKNVSAAYTESMSRAFRAQSEIRITIKRSTQDIIFGTEILTNVTQTTDIDPISRRLPTEELSFSIMDLEGLYDINSPSAEWKDIDANATVTLEYGYHVNGVIEWLDKDVYILSGKPSYNKGIATFNAQKRLATLTGIYYKGNFPSGNISYSSLAIQVLSDAGLSTNEYVLDDYLTNYTAYAPMPIDTYRNCLQMIAHACGCALYTDSNGRITIKNVNFITLNSNGFHLNRRDVVRDSESITKLEPLYKTEAYRYGYSDFETNPQEIYKATLEINDTVDYHIEFPAAKNVFINVNGTEISANIYAESADFVLSGNGETAITATGYPVKKSANIYTKLVSSDSTAETETLQNPLVTDYSVCAILAENTALYLQYRTTNSLSYRGNPEIQALDCIDYSTKFGDVIKALVLKSTIVFNGTLRGELILKNISKKTESPLYDKNGEEVYDNTEELITTNEPEYIRSDYTTDQMDEFIGKVI